MQNKRATEKPAFRRSAIVDAQGRVILRLPELPLGTRVEAIILAESTPAPACGPLAMQAPPASPAPSDAEALALMELADAERARLFP